MRRFFQIVKLTMLAMLLSVNVTMAGASLDGRSFVGMIGPAENPDLDDSLHFSDGHFWSDICTRCGFVPGVYTTEMTEDGIRFTGLLESESRGRFTYDGLVLDDGTIKVSINWERKRWYWTSRREIGFQGSETRDDTPSLVRIQAKMDTLNPNESPLCARF